MSNKPRMCKLRLTRRELAQRALTGAAGAIFLSVLAPAARAQVVDPLPAVPPLPLVPVGPVSGEGDLLIALVPFQAGYALSETQAREVELRLRSHVTSFTGARAYVLPEEVGPAFTADAPPRKGRTR